MLKQDLIQTIEHAIEIEIDYIAIAVMLPGAKEPEFIINPIENAESKLTYYKNAYDDNCKLKNNSNIEIVAVAFGVDPSWLVREMGPHKDTPYLEMEEQENA